MTVSHSLDAYLEPTRLSFSSPPASELLPQGQSSDESYPVFSPLPRSDKHDNQSSGFEGNVTVSVSSTTATTSNTLQPGSLSRHHRRQSSVTVSWTDQGDTTLSRVRHISMALDPSNVSCNEQIFFQLICLGCAFTISI